jgi:16S rRNA A1518/A1519 N6-dimethyltransferase RsmA/KsgA/DIM1 with predicted DNA glycosylase/AP lyase activity
LFAEANNALSVVAQILATVVAEKVGLQVFFTKKHVFQRVFNLKHLSNCDKHINNLKKSKKLFKKLKSTRNKKV